MKFSLALLYATESFTTTVLCEMRSATDALKCSSKNMHKGNELLLQTVKVTHEP